jgi:hypothetical protein
MKAASAQRSTLYSVLVAGVRTLPGGCGSIEVAVVTRLMQGRDAAAAVKRIGVERKQQDGLKAARLSAIAHERGWWMQRRRRPATLG